MSEPTASSESRNVGRLLVAEWRAIGGVGRAALLGLLAAVALTVAMGFSITRAARTNLLDARAQLIAAEVEALPPIAANEALDSASVAVLGEAIEHELLGGETERVKVWSPAGEIQYSDDPGLIGRTFALSEPARAALEGSVATEISDLQDPAHAADRAAGELIEVYVPMLVDGRVAAVVEVEQRLDSLNEAMSRIRRNVWFSIVFGVGVLAIFLSALGISLARRATRRRQAVERVLGASFRAQEEERRRIVGALHDDIGQPLYRLLYGLEGSRAKLGADSVVADELERLEDVVREIDGTLRNELHHLHPGFAADAGLATALRDLAGRTASESQLRVQSDLGPEPTGLSSVQRTALFRAVQEAVINARKHAGAANLWIEMRELPGRVSVRVDDDGAGTHTEPGLGLTTMRERIEALGGEVVVARRRGGGTSVQAWLPVGEAP